MSCHCQNDECQKVLVHSPPTISHISLFTDMEWLRGYCTPKKKLACFALYLKIINTVLKNDIGIF